MLKLMNSKISGYLLKKKILKTTPSHYFKRYFTIQEGRMFEYTEEKSNEPYLSLNLKEMIKCNLHPSDNMTIVLEFKEGVFHFKAST